MNKWKLAEYMEKADYTQRSLAKALGIGRNTINNKINGHGTFNTKEVVEICHLLCITNREERSDIFLS